jgi:glycosyltransferase involved in cell wall biosynthesis
MKVLHVIPSVSDRSGGPATAIVPLCRALREQGIDALLLTTTEEFSDMNTNRVVDFKGVPARFFPAQFGASFKYSRPLRAWLDANIAEFDLAHIHAVFNHSSVAAARACRKADVPYVVRPLGTLDPWSMKQKAMRKRVFWWLSGRKMLEGSAAVHYTAQAEKDATEGYLRVNHGRVVPLGVDANWTTDEGNKERTSDEAKPYVLVLSRLHPKKRIDLLIDAFASLDANDWRLVIAGDGPADHVALLKAKARDDERIVFTGWVEGERKDALLAGASLFALASRQENFGLSVLEAMAVGVPALLSPEVNIALDVEAAGAGWIGDLSQLTSQLARILADDCERDRRARAAREFAKQYSWERTATELRALYTEILAQ